MLHCADMRNYHLNKKQLQKLREAHRKAKRADKAIQADKIKAIYLLGICSGIFSRSALNFLNIQNNHCSLRIYLADYDLT